MPATKLKVNVNAQQREYEHLNIGDDVELVANGDCTLYFTDKAVFGMSEITLTKNQTKTLTVKGNGATSLAAFQPATRTLAVGGRTRSQPTDIIVP
jgi:hypothetical protein